MFFFNPALHRPAPKMFGAALRRFFVNVVYVPYADNPDRYFEEIFSEVSDAWHELSRSDRARLACPSLPESAFTQGTLLWCIVAHDIFLQRRDHEKAELPHAWQYGKRRYS